MNSFDRLRALMFIWAAFAVAAGLAFVGNAPTNSQDIVLAMVFATAAVIGTGMVIYGNAEADAKLQALEKSKRNRPDIYEMVDSLDDEELRMLRQRLMSDSDSAMNLQDLMPRQQNQRQK
jgi:hypothetical protein